MLLIHHECFDFLTANETQIVGTPLKTEFKSPAEERLIRKMAKMALNGYEIGIQRKIKPADHIQSMADKIQDTVVTKHPLNADSLSSGESSREGTLRRPLHKHFGNYNTADSIQNIGDKIRDTIISNHPTHAVTNVNSINNNIPSPPPPPLPNSPIPTFNVHSTPIGHSLQMNNAKKPLDFIPKNLSNNFIADAQPHFANNFEKSNNGSGYSSSDDSNKDKYDNSYTNTLRKNSGIEKSFLNGMNNTSIHDGLRPDQKIDNNYSNTLSKRNIFEKRDITNGSTDNYNKNIEKRNNGTSDTKSLKKPSIFEKSSTMENSKNNSFKDEETLKKDTLPSSLYDNTLYTFKNNGTQDVAGIFKDFSNSVPHKEYGNQKELSNSSEKHDDKESDVIVKRRQKKNERHDDGRRDSHIVTRPLSTMTSVDVTDGNYPVCHKCDKAITR